MSKDFQLEAKYSPAGDQPEAIERLVKELDDGEAVLVRRLDDQERFPPRLVGAGGH